MRSIQIACLSISLIFFSECQAIAQNSNLPNSSDEVHRPPPTAPSVPAPLQSGSLPTTKRSSQEAKPAKAKPRRRRAQRTPRKLTSREVYITMVRGTLTALNQANYTNNYSVLYGLTTSRLQKNIDLKRFAEAFVNLRNQKVDLTPTLIQLPRFTSMPKKWPRDVLALKGFIVTPAIRVGFAIVYRPERGVWHIDNLSVTAKGHARGKAGAAKRPTHPGKSAGKTPFEPAAATKFKRTKATKKTAVKQHTSIPLPSPGPGKKEVRSKNGSSNWKAATKPPVRGTDN